MKRWKPTKGYVCECGVCAAERAKRAARPRQTTRKELEAILVDERQYSLTLYRNMQGLAADAKVGRRVLNQARRNLDAVWRSQDGRELRVQGMSDSHLFYALAKGRRGEYGTNSWAADKIASLESEAIRRLAGIHGAELKDPALEEAMSWGR